MINDIFLCFESLGRLDEAMSQSGELLHVGCGKQNKKDIGNFLYYRNRKPDFIYVELLDKAKNEFGRNIREILYGRGL